MSFWIEIETTAMKASVADRICSAVKGHGDFVVCREEAGCLRILSFGLIRKKVIRHFYIDSADSFLTDDHDPDELVLKMDSTKLEAFANTVEAFHRALAQPFSLFPAWQGEKPRKVVECSLAEFTEVVKKGQIENKVRYVIAASET